MKAKIIVKSIIFNRRLRKILIIQRCNSDPIGAGTWEGAGDFVRNNIFEYLGME